MAGGEHVNHRERMRQRFLEHGLDNFADHEVLELLLFYAIPRGDVNPLAHRLIDSFGSLANVLEAETEDLCRVEGMGTKTAAFLRMLPPMFRRYQTSKLQGSVFNTTEKVAEYLLRYYIGRPREQLSAVLLDNQCRLIRICDIAEGSTTSVHINIRKLIQCVLQYNAAHVILAHNHPRGRCSPSRADIVQTSTIREMLKNIDVRLVDHIIIAEDQWISLASR
ncbi:JAB domain-containing protein [Butyricicoccus sp.]|uniref:JAB domain-containing protein n=1 Tax=Butyricicoccus sp. TaxID=2049021 RepID=UPI003D7D2638